MSQEPRYTQYEPPKIHILRRINYEENMAMGLGRIGCANVICSDIKCHWAAGRNSYTEICPKCGKKLIGLGVITRVPKKRASMRTWRKFYNTFVYKKVVV